MQKKCFKRQLSASSYSAQPIVVSLWDTDPRVWGWVVPFKPGNKTWFQGQGDSAPLPSLPAYLIWAHKFLNLQIPIRKYQQTK